MAATDRNGLLCTQQNQLFYLLLFALIATHGFPSISRAQDTLGVSVPEEFEVTLYADDDLAHDIYSMTVDSFGRVVVSGAGYVKILIDADQDGKAESAKTFVDGPKLGAQGMYFAGNDLLCSADGGLIRYKDRNADDRADGPPDLFWKVKTGGEHDLHAIRKGPDGWWYSIAGNMAGVNDKYVTLPTSPVKHPKAGTILRFKPDLSGAEVYADGLRNAYDFDFNDSGDLFTFDSDGERDISLPWYRPTRVFHVLPGSHHGWFTRSWKRPDSFFDMPPAVAEFGRGSPTGVETYRHKQFPENYFGALFVLDWTYGRVLALPLQQNGSSWSSEPIEFMTAVGQHGFAPTDVVVGPQGELYVSVGGRGTRGGVYRIRAKDDSTLGKPVAYGLVIPKSADEKVEQCLNAPQPLSSWSRRVWEPMVAELTSEPFISAALDKQRSVPQRVRAIEILTEKFGGLDGDMLYSLAADPSADVRARAAWSLGRSQAESPNHRDLASFIQDEDPHVIRVAMEALLGASEQTFENYIPSLGAQLAHSDKYIRQTAMRLLANASSEVFREMAAAGFQIGWNASIPVAAAYSMRNPGVERYPIDLALRVLKSNRDTQLKLEAVRVLQIGLGDLVPGTDDIEAVYDGYASPADLAKHSDELTMVRAALASLYPSGDDKLDWELERVISMVQTDSSDIFESLLAKVNDESHPVDDIHHLIVASRISASRTIEQRDLIAKTLVNLEQKIKARNLRQDSNWADRTLEMYTGLVNQDPELPLAILKTPGFGRAGHVHFLSELDPEYFDEAISKFSQLSQSDPDYAWNPEVVLLIAESTNPADQKLLRSKFEDFALRNSVVLALASDPQESDRGYFVQAMESAPVDILQECVNALGLLSASTDANENVALVRALRRIGSQDEERQVRDQLVELLRRNLKQNFGYRFGMNGDPQRPVIDAWTNAVREQFSEAYAASAGDESQNIEQVKTWLSKIDWNAGDIESGKALYTARGCVQCHGGRQALGPDLAGAAGRFSSEDLFTAIMFPNHDVSPRYQTTQIVMTNGKVRTGLIVYESVDGVVLRDSSNRTYRIETEEIEVRRRLNQSIMPTGLLKDLTDQDVAHLYAYLRTLGTRRTATATRTAE